MESSTQVSLVIIVALYLGAGSTHSLCGALPDLREPAGPAAIPLPQLPRTAGKAIQVHPRREGRRDPRPLPHIIAGPLQEAERLVRCGIKDGWCPRPSLTLEIIGVGAGILPQMNVYAVMFW